MLFSFTIPVYIGLATTVVLLLIVHLRRRALITNGSAFTKQIQRLLMAENWRRAELLCETCGPKMLLPKWTAALLKNMENPASFSDIQTNALEDVTQALERQRTLDILFGMTGLLYVAPIFLISFLDRALLNTYLNTILFPMITSILFALCFILSSRALTKSLNAIDEHLTGLKIFIQNKL